MYFVVVEVQIKCKSNDFDCRLLRKSNKWIWNLYLFMEFFLLFYFSRRTAKRRKNSETETSKLFRLFNSFGKQELDFQLPSSIRRLKLRFMSKAQSFPAKNKNTLQIMLNFKIWFDFVAGSPAHYQYPSNIFAHPIYLQCLAVSYGLKCNTNLDQILKCFIRNSDSIALQMILHADKLDIFRYAWYREKKQYFGIQIRNYFSKT